MTFPPDAASARQRFGISFALLARAWRHEIDRNLSDQGLSGATWVPMLHLAASGGGITQKELARLTGIEAPSLVRLLEILEREGLVSRRACPQDGRARLVDLTPEGETRLAEVRASLYTIEERLLAGVSDEQLSNMLNVLGIIRKNIDETGSGRA
ncbi:MarR family winged helix-turn-helix transcriptional regulator [Pseudogemmobacter faecipullorum]|uniref:MarR family transcriptional regulator n=1 Tax=Pseudogemmobacter faecipullorum TaxID=2755041 RepID=A0ABS8CGU7_9RHOB|nr:MarR family transcriptional regulator [Pseudogemmobacter faecipullorum]MCB5408611.1 MarR family transcriptional regulator [Pseudogemmobacter faecipullorum]